LCINKSDLATRDDFTYIEEYYKYTDITIITMSAKKNENVEVLHQYVDNKLSIFFGYSGVGKSTIINCLSPGLDLRVSHISESTGKGRHTTTNAEMIELDNNTRIVDTPGMREFGIADIEPQDLSKYFSEFVEYLDMCNFRGCSHDHEPRCAIKEKLDEGLISPGRYQSYLNILHSIQESLKNKY
jgi:ribosome biogenesis GTPase